MSPFVVAEDELLYNQRALLIDDARLTADRPAARERWLSPWGLLADFEVPDPVVRADQGVPPIAAPGDVRIVVKVEPSGVVSALSLSSPAIGGSAAYVLLETSETELTIESPASFVD